MSIVLLGATSGSVTLQEPAVAGTTVIDLPATSGTMAVTSGSPSFTNITATGTLAVNGNTTLGDATTDTLTVGVTGIVKDASGNVGIGTASPLAKLQTDSSSSTYSANIRARNSNFGNGVVGAASGILTVATDMNNIAFYTGSNLGVDGTSVPTNERMRIDSSGNLIIAKTASSSLSAVGCYTETTGSGANMVIASNGYMIRSTSSLKYKKNVQDANHGLADLLKLRSVTYESKNESEDGIVYGGLIAEEVDAVGLTEFVQYADDKTPDALSYGNMVSLCIKAIQEQQALITQLQADVAALKGA